MTADAIPYQHIQTTSVVERAAACGFQHRDTRVTKDLFLVAKQACNAARTYPAPGEGGEGVLSDPAMAHALRAFYAAKLTELVPDDLTALLRQISDKRVEQGGVWR